jgi:hypothetical protein
MSTMNDDLIPCDRCGELFASRPGTRVPTCDSCVRGVMAEAPDLIPCDRCCWRAATWASRSLDYPTGYDSTYAPEQDVCDECLTDEERADFLLWGTERQAQRDGLAFTDREA